MISLANITKFFTLVLVILLHLTLLLNVQFTLWPEMVVYPFLMNNDFSLYRDIIMPYQPAFPVFLEFFSKAFGYNPLPYQLLTWFLIVLIDILVFVISKKISGKISHAFGSLIFFSIVSIPFGVNGLWFDLVQTPLIILSVYFYYLFLKNPQKLLMFYSFLFDTIAYFIKQQVIWLIFIYLAGLFLIIKKSRIIPEIIFLSLLPFITLFSIETFLFWKVGTLWDFVYWTLFFPFIKASSMPGYILLPNLKQLVVVGILFLFFIPTILKKQSEKLIFIIIALILTIFAYPRFDYFHLIPALSILSLVAGENIKNGFQSKNLFIKSVFFLSLIFLLAITTRFIYKNQTYEIRFFERDIYTAASFIYRITNENDLIYIQNGPDLILPISNLKPPKPWADEFPWYLEIPQVQERIVDGLTKGNPRFIIYKPYDAGDKYEIGIYRPSKIASYIEENYENVMQITDTLWLKHKK